MARLADRARKQAWSPGEFLIACLQRELAARKAHGGEAGFEFTVVELLEDDTLGPLGRDTWLKETWGE